MGKPKKRKRMTVVAAEVLPKQYLSIDSSKTKGFENPKVGQKIKFSGSGMVRGVRMKDEYEKGSGNIINVEVDSISNSPNVKKEKIRPRSDLMRRY